MTRRDRIGASVLAVLFILSACVLAWTLRPRKPAHTFENSVVVKERIKNIERFHGDK